ncbi:hypothetical protein EHS25_009652 [Saitozyma podzolica]|uniref:Uncharacterized protein n=1 Tax=Saitozyma podzolica TaxID=1890683 RepID=A0A427YJU8_9TREE|nr:hypothetical protein EHS25_009652 [Saitozyma podzolica]
MDRRFELSGGAGTGRDAGRPIPSSGSGSGSGFGLGGPNPDSNILSAFGLRSLGWLHSTLWHPAYCPEFRPLTPFALPNLPAARNSVSSLMDAVVGPASHSRSQHATVPPSVSNPSPPSRRTPSSLSHGDSESWDVLSDASLRLNEGGSDEAVVQELQQKVDKRRSQLPQLETQLAALEAKIKAAEERLAAAQAASGGQGGTQARS